MNEIIVANISWNPFGWRNNDYINPSAGHTFARNNFAHESLNFNFNKKAIDTEKIIHGYIQWTNGPISFKKGGLIIFYTKNTDTRKGQIVGVYGKAETFKDSEKHKLNNQEYWTNVKAERAFSLLFPIPLLADNYKTYTSERIVGQIGFAYKDKQFAEQILFDELTELSKAGNNENDYNILMRIYEYYIGKKFKRNFNSNDEKEQSELEVFYKKHKTKSEILAELKDLKETESEEVIVNRKAYKRDNKTIAQIKVLRDFKCQICSTSIIKKDGSKYIEAAHIKPKFQKGRETLDNIILLCPNCHKEFDLGLLVIKNHDARKIEFSLNGKFHKINFEL